MDPRQTEEVIQSKLPSFNINHILHDIWNQLFLLLPYAQLSLLMLVDKSLLKLILHYLNNQKENLKKENIYGLMSFVKQFPASLNYFLEIRQSNVSEDESKKYNQTQTFINAYFDKIILFAVCNPLHAQEVFKFIEYNLTADMLSFIPWDKTFSETCRSIFYVLRAKSCPWMKALNDREIREINNRKGGFKRSSISKLGHLIDITECLGSLKELKIYFPEELPLLEMSLNVTTHLQKVDHFKIINTNSKTFYINISGAYLNASEIDWFDYNKNLNLDSDLVCPALNIHTLYFRMYKIVKNEIDEGNPLKNLHFTTIKIKHSLRLADAFLNLCEQGFSSDHKIFLTQATKNIRYAFDDEEYPFFNLNEGHHKKETWFACLYARRYYLRKNNTEKADIIKELMDEIVNNKDNENVKSSGILKKWLDKTSAKNGLTYLAILNQHQNINHQNAYDFTSGAMQTFGLFGKNHSVNIENVPNFFKTDAAKFFLKLYEQVQLFEKPVLTPQEQVKSNSRSNSLTG